MKLAEARGSWAGIDLLFEDIPDKSFDLVTSIDVVEHVEDDEHFVRELARIGREAIFLMTPNWTTSRCVWPYHLREYTPREFMQLLTSLGQVRLFKGNPNGEIAHHVTYPSAYNTLNDLRTWPLTAFPTRCVNHLLPNPARLHSHNAALVVLS